MGKHIFTMTFGIVCGVHAREAAHAAGYSVTLLFHIVESSCLCILRCLKRRLSTKNGKVQLLTLTLLETLVKNCGATFQSDLAQSDLWTDVATLADPRRKGDMQVVDKARD